MDHVYLSSANTVERPCPLPTPQSSRSFWHSEPDELLLGYRSTPDLPSEADVVVVGCGITGANVARYLSEDGQDLKIVVLEAREVCWGATGRNGGHCQPLLFDAPPSVARFELSNCEAVRSYIEENKVECEYRSVTGCRTFWTEPELARAIEAVEQLQKDDPSVGEHVSVITNPSELGRCRVGSGCPGATLTKGAASLWPYKLVAHIVRDLVVKNKINLQTNTPVESLSQSEDGQWTLRTGRGNLKTRHVVLATNGYTSHLLPDFAPLIVPCRGHMTALVPPKQELGQEEMLPCSYGMKGYSPTAASGSDDYLIQRPFIGVPNPKGHLMFGGGKNEGKLPVFGPNVADDSVVDPDTISYLQKSLLDMLHLPGRIDSLEKLKADFAWSGIMGFSRDVAPWVGQMPNKKGLWTCAGYTGHGMPNAMLCAKAVADMVLDQETSDSDATAFQKRLVEEGRLPPSYLVSAERIQAALELPTVQVQEALDCMGFVGGKWTLMHALEDQNVKEKL